MRDVRKAVFYRLSEKLDRFRPGNDVSVPENGWVSAIRSSINMSRKQLARKMGVTSESIRQLEQREARGSISLNSLRDAATAMDMQLVYAVVPKNGSLQDYVEEKARKLATQVILRTNQQMKLEAQQIDEQKLKEAIDESTEELVRALDSKLWDLK